MDEIWYVILTLASVVLGAVLSIIGTEWKDYRNRPIVKTEIYAEFLDDIDFYKREEYLLIRNEGKKTLYNFKIGIGIRIKTEYPDRQFIPDNRDYNCKLIVLERLDPDERVSIRICSFKNTPEIKEIRVFGLNKDNFVSTEIGIKKEDRDCIEEDKGGSYLLCNCSMKEYDIKFDCKFYARDTSLGKYSRTCTLEYVRENGFVFDKEDYAEEIELMFTCVD